jgi:hypothetical protein
MVAIVRARSGQTAVGSSDTVPQSLPLRAHKGQTLCHTAQRGPTVRHFRWGNRLRAALHAISFGAPRPGHPRARRGCL